MSKRSPPPSPHDAQKPAPTTSPAAVSGPELESQSTATTRVEAARRRLLAACSAYAPKWERLFRRLDGECSGALQEKRFRLALRRLLRVRVEQLSDGEIHDCFEGADRNRDRALDSAEFVQFMMSQHDSSESAHASDSISNATVLVGGASEPKHVEIPKSEDSNPVQMRTRRRGRGAAAAGAVSPPRRALKKNKSKRSNTKKKSPFASPTRQTANAPLPAAALDDDEMDYAPVVATPQSKSVSPGKRRSKLRRNKSVLL